MIYCKTYVEHSIDDECKMGKHRQVKDTTMYYCSDALLLVEVHHFNADILLHQDAYDILSRNSIENLNYGSMKSCCIASRIRLLYRKVYKGVLQSEVKLQEHMCTWGFTIRLVVAQTSGVSVTTGAA